MWHASLAFQTANGPIPFEKWKRKQLKAGIRTGEMLLLGCGASRKRMIFVTEPPGVCLHIQVVLAPHELNMLPPEWMSIPAVDELGPCRIIREG